jgi:hypothetical protein
LGEHDDAVVVLGLVVVAGENLSECGVGLTRELYMLDVSCDEVAV